MVTNRPDRDDPDSAHALERLATAMVAVTARAIAASVAAGDLTLPQWRALVVIAAGDGLRVSAIAARLQVSVSSGSRLLRRLERRGLVAIDVDSTDLRALIVRATPAGQAVRDHVIRRRVILLAEALAEAPLPPDAAATLAAIEIALRRYA
jgi:DNA-binding MarR family transcriptional regulator